MDEHLAREHVAAAALRAEMDFEVEILRDLRRLYAACDTANRAYLFDLALNRITANDLLTLRVYAPRCCR